MYLANSLPFAVDFTIISVFWKVLAQSINRSCDETSKGSSHLTRWHNVSVTSMIQPTRALYRDNTQNASKNSIRLNKTAVTKQQGIALIARQKMIQFQQKHNSNKVSISEIWSKCLMMNFYRLKPTHFQWWVCGCVTHWGLRAFQNMNS